jgi:hypothetical protein
MTVFDEFAQIDQLAGKLQNGLQQIQERLQGGMPNIGGGLGGVTSYLPWVAFAWIAYLVWRRGEGPTLALSDFEINQTARVRNGTVIRISGRRKGFAGKLFSSISLDPVTTWSATKEAVHYESTGLFGRSMSIIPLRHVHAIRTEHGISAMSLALGAIVFLVGVMYFASWIGKGACLAGIGMAVYTFMNRRFLIGVESSSGRVAIAVQPSLLGGPSFDLDKLEEAGRLLQKLVGAAERRKTAKEDREAVERGPVIPLAPARPVAARPLAPPAIEPLPPAPRIAEPPVSRTGPPSASAAVPPPVAPVSGRSVFEPDQPPKPRPMRFKPKRELRVPRDETKTPATNDEERLAADAFDAAVRVFESKRPSEAEAAWWALIRRWPNTDAARRARRILDNRRKRERERKGL